jgi:Rrf2 family protein
MSTALRIGESASLALHSLAIMARHSSRQFSAADLARILGASPHTLAKTLHRLAQARLLRSERGRRGGFSLAVRPDALRLARVYNAVEGPLARSACLLHRPVCDGRSCVLGGLIESSDRRLREYLGSTTLASLAGRVHIDPPAGRAARKGRSP